MRYDISILAVECTVTKNELIFPIQNETTYLQLYNFVHTVQTIHNWGIPKQCKTTFYREYLEPVLTWTLTKRNNSNTQASKLLRSTEGGK